MTVSRFIRVCRQRILALFRKEQLDEQLDRELSFHLEQLVLENVELGMNAEQARLHARRALGNLGRFKEECRDERRVAWLYDFHRDVSYGLRMLRKNPGFTAIAAISLAIGIGANTAIIGAAATLLLGDLHLPDSDRLVYIRSFPEQNPQQLTNVTVPDYVAWKEQSHSFEAVGASFGSDQDFGMDEIGNPAERVHGHAVTPSLLRALRVEPAIGRLFRDEEAEIDNAAPIIILSYSLWQRRFGADADILHKQIRVNGRSLTVVGVMPEGFWYPVKATEYWTPFALNRFQLQGSARLFAVTARLKPEVSIQQAQNDVTAICARLAREFPGRNAGWGARVEPLREFWFGWARQPLLMLEAAVALLLLIACANVATLLLARASARRSEIQMRLVLGARRSRIVRQLLTESMVLSLIGGTLGLLIAIWGVRSLALVNAPLGRIPMSDLGVNAGTFAVMAAVSMVASILIGILPALTAFSARDPIQHVSAHGRPRRLPSVLVAVQIGLALTLLIGCGLLINSLVRLTLFDRGFDTKGVLTFDYRIPVQQYVRPSGLYHGIPVADVVTQVRTLQRVYERLAALPGADSVAGSSGPPLNGILLPTATVQVEGRPSPEAAAERTASTVVYFMITPSFFSTMRTALIRGRDFDAKDTASSPWVAIVNETMARRFWPGEDPIGKRFTVDAVSGERPREIVGVVRDTALQTAQVAPPQPIAYTVYLQQADKYTGFNGNRFGEMNFFIRTARDPQSIVLAARQAVAEIDPDRPLGNIRTMEDMVDSALGTRRYYMTVFGTFAALATVLASIGVYGVTAYSVSQRAREIGIRMAVGATGRSIATLVGQRVCVFVATGLLLGLLGAWALTKLIAAQLWGITPTDPATFIALTAFVVGIAFVASLVPVRRAMRVDPNEVLRTD